MLKNNYAQTFILKQYAYKVADMISLCTKEMKSCQLGKIRLFILKLLRGNQANMILNREPQLIENTRL